MRAVWLTAGALATVAALLLSTILVWNGFARATAPQERRLRSIPFALDKLKVTTGSGEVNLEIVPGPAGELTLDRSVGWTSIDRPMITEDWNGDTLRLDIRCRGSRQPNGPMCRADYTLLVPFETEVEARTTIGDLMVGQVIGAVRLTTVSGDVLADGVTGEVWARSGSGTIRGNSLLGGRADVETGSGDVQLDFANPPLSVRAVARATGDVELRMPAETYDVTAEGRRTEVEVDAAKGAPRKIEARAPLGSVRVCCG
ncbi:hypothetical protein DMB42_49395 [Nonomuraea sp. WAC 01424]|uniref:DUF4097 family beta strand repeat-containing protein n=1 Tax=Nonomuraea sp. WAC 01424 TaxID=2203200 RepID=UPI000F77A6FD|nr:DUF4097 family beta strand repeat-containing protein [Nonomuraea sp. WAC 01424]RSM95573.1 hypothetical protein DMB42_49395 [Nonomuraea sp. WAC 01424]